MVQNTLILLFLDHSLKENLKSKNSFRTCESQFEKHYLSLFQVVIDFLKKYSRITEGIGQPFVIVIMRFCDR